MTPSGWPCKTSRTKEGDLEVKEKGGGGVEMTVKWPKEHSRLECGRGRAGGIGPAAIKAEVKIFSASLMSLIA